MVRRMASIALLSVLVASSVADAQVVDIGISTGDWVGNPTTLTGGFSEVTNAANVSIEVNGVLASVVPDPFDNTRGTWSLAFSNLSFSSQTPQHKLKAFLYEGLDPDPHAIDRVTYYDTADSYSFTRTPGTLLHTNGVHVRLNEMGTFDVFEALVAAGAKSWGDDLEEHLDPDNPVDFDPPVSPCATLAALGLSFNDLGLDSTSFGISTWPANAPSPVGVSVCVDRFRFDPTAIDTESIADPPDLDGDGAADAFLELDSRVGALHVDTTAGPVSMSGDLTFWLDVNIDVSLAFVVPLPVGVSLTAVDNVKTSCSATATMDHFKAVADLNLEPDPAEPGRIKAEPIPGTTNIIMGPVGVTATGLCGALASFANVPEPTAQALSPVITMAADGDPSDPDDNGFVANQFAQFIDDWEPVEPIELEFLENSATINPQGAFSFIDEDADGITTTIKTKFAVDTYSGTRDAVRQEPDVYLQDNHAENFDPVSPQGHPYMFAPAISAGTMTQFLHAAYHSGLLHTSLTELDFESLGICLDDGAGGCLTGPQSITAGTLTEVFPGLDSVLSFSSLKLEIRSGFGLPPVVVVDDVPGTARLKISAMHYTVAIYFRDSAPGAEPLLSYVGDLFGYIDLSTDSQGELVVRPNVAVTLGAGRSIGTVLSVQPPIAAYQDEVNEALESLIPDVVALSPLPSLSVDDGTTTANFLPLDVETQTNDETLYLDLMLAP
ncbi:MAG: hypothetical protein AAGA48_04335 [Myxococcota bacterium]